MRWEVKKPFGRVWKNFNQKKDKLSLEESQSKKISYFTSHLIFRHLSVILKLDKGGLPWKFADCVFVS